MTDPKTPGDPFGGLEEEGSAVRRALALPDVIDRRYRVLARLGAGAMGVVLRAEDLFLRRPVAIKVVEPDQQVVERFVKEAQALAQVRHENVVQVYAFGPFQTSYYLAMELVVGQPLDTLIDSHTLAGETMPLPRAMKILRAIALGLEAVHARHLVHRDVKPGNVIIEKATDRPVLIDFGLARRRTKSNPKLSITGGTPSYMAPEQAKDPDGTRVTAQTDLYALACTAFELLTGRPVFEGDDIYTILVAHISSPPRKISTVRPELAPIDDVLLRALAKDPSDRQASVVELIEQLEQGIGRVGSGPAPRLSGAAALVVAADNGLRRSLLRSTVQSLKSRAIALGCEEVASASEAAALLGSTDCRVLVIDEESAAGRLAELVQLARARNPRCEIVIVSRDFPATQASLGSQRVRHLVPKPVNVHVLAAVLGRIDPTGLSP